MRLKSAIIALPLLAALIAAGCGTSSNQNTQPANQITSGASNNLLQQVKTDGKLKVGTEGTYAPFTFHDSAGKLTGFDVEIAQEVAKRIGVQAQFVETQWDGMFAGLDSKRFDLVANQVGIRDDRKQKYDFSVPYTTSRAVLLVNKDNDTIKSFADLKGKKAAQSLTSNYGDIAKQNGAELVGVEGFNQAIDLLASKRADATINDSLSFLDLTKQKPNVPVKKVAEQDKAAQSGLLFRKGSNELVDAVNTALNDMQKDGTFLSISQKYFGTDVSK